MIAVAALPASRHALDARPVLDSAPLRAGFSRADLSRVGDASWDFSPAVMRANVRRCARGDAGRARLVALSTDRATTGTADGGALVTDGGCR